MSKSQLLVAMLTMTLSGANAIAGNIGSTIRVGPTVGGGGAGDGKSNYDTPAVRSAAREVAAVQRDISRILADLRRDFEASQEVRDARAMLRKTTADYQEVCVAALAPLQTSVEHRQIVLTVQKLEQQLAWGRFDDRMTDAQIAATARKLLDARLQKASIEAKALAADPAVATARFAMIDANGQLIALQREFAQSIISNPQFAQAKDRLEAVRAQLSRSR